MEVTRETSQFEMSPLKDVWANIEIMSVTWDTSHVPIGPCGPLEQSDESLRHASTASLSSLRVFGENTVADEALTPTPSAGDSVVRMRNVIKFENAVREVMEVAGSRLFLV